MVFVFTTGQNDPPEVYAGSDYSGDLTVGGLVVDFDNDLTQQPSVTDDGRPNPPKIKGKSLTKER